MTRIAAAPKVGLRGKLVYFFTRRSFTKMTGRQPAIMIEPLGLYAHRPGLLRAYGRFEQATAKLRRLDWRLQVLAELKAAHARAVRFCIDLTSQIARQSGLSGEQLLALPRYSDSDLFTDLEKLVMDYAVGLSRTPAEVSDELFAQLRARFDDATLVELTHHIGVENLRGRFNVAFGVGAAGFSEGRVCALPATVVPDRSRLVA